MNGSQIAWRQVSRGLCLVGIGVFLILTTQGLLPWSFWLQVLAYWPVLLVALGIRLVFERSRAPWAILAAPLVVLGTLTYVAMQGPRAEPGHWKPLNAERPTDTSRWTLRGSLAVADLRLTARSLSAGLLVDGRMAGRGRGHLRVSERGERALVRLGYGGWCGSVVVLPGPRKTLDLGLAEDLPLTLDLDLALARSDIDLEKVALSRFDVDGAFNDMTLRLGAPADDVRLSFDGAFNHIEIEVPPTTPVRVQTDGFLNLVDGRSGAGRLEGPGYRLRLEGAFNRVEIRSH